MNIYSFSSRTISCSEFRNMFDSQRYGLRDHELKFKNSSLVLKLKSLPYLHQRALLLPMSGHSLSFHGQLKEKGESVDYFCIFKKVP